MLDKRSVVLMWDASRYTGHRYVTPVPETERQMEFYSRARYDDLVSRVETPSEMTETFKNRLDFLYYRHVVYDKRVGAIGTGETPKQVQRTLQVTQTHTHPQYINLSPAEALAFVN